MLVSDDDFTGAIVSSPKGEDIMTVRKVKAELLKSYLSVCVCHVNNAIYLTRRIECDLVCHPFECE